MNRARDVRDQIVGLLDRVEIKLETNPNSGDTIPTRKVFIKDNSRQYVLGISSMQRGYRGQVTHIAR